MRKSSSADAAIFKYKGYELPVGLVNLTGGGVDTWDIISRGHMEEYARYCPIEPHHTVLEPGCGVGRDAISLTKVLGKNGRYIGIDIIKPSIEWCQQNITPKQPNFVFHYLDIQSQIHNPGGQSATTSYVLPASTLSVDRIVLHSVFTHMFRDDIVHYLREFARVLRPGGLVMASVFVMSDEALEMAAKTNGPLKFEHKLGDGCYINDPEYPEGAVGYTMPALEAILKSGGMRLAQPIHYGFWCGRENVKDGQDILVLRATWLGWLKGNYHWFRIKAWRLSKKIENRLKVWLRASA
jgi:SAM-dependent methyltransferase